MKIAPLRVPLRQPRADKRRPPARCCSRPAVKSSPPSPLPPRLHWNHHAVPMALPQTSSSRPPVTSAHVQERQCLKGLPLALVKRAVNRDLCFENAARGGMLETHIFCPAGRGPPSVLDCLSAPYGSCSSESRRPTCWCQPICE